jgi:hypothetical protein
LTSHRQVDSWICRGWHTFAGRDSICAPPAAAPCWVWVNGWRGTFGTFDCPASALGVELDVDVDDGKKDARLLNDDMQALLNKSDGAIQNNVRMTKKAGIELIIEGCIERTVEGRGCGEE